LYKNLRSGITNPPKRPPADHYFLGIVFRAGRINASLFFFEQDLKMAQEIDQNQVRKVAKLSRLELTEAEVEEFTGQLSAILGYVEKLNELNTDGVEPLAHCLPVSNVLREDCPRESLGTQKVLANAPQRDDEFFKVPKILDDGSGA
jgi:aspartyl-tRNA(Asn)/glutamyl-tRNA(Gln) amidotransferase subunit C